MQKKRSLKNRKAINLSQIQNKNLTIRVNKTVFKNHAVINLFQIQQTISKSV